MKRPRNKIAVLICYMGNLPWYFKYFLHSCEYNSSIDFFIFNDIDYTGSHPANVFFFKTSLSGIREKASKAIGYEVNIDTPYKICEYKPVYGLMFSDYIKEYDFWAQSDIDVIYGDIRAFLPDESLDKLDFVSTRHDWATGCFTLFRNSELMNNIFRRGKDNHRVFTDSSYYGFDEFNFMHNLIDEMSLWEIPTNIQTFTHIVKAAAEANEIKVQFEFISLEGTPGKIKFDAGKIIYNNRLEAMIYHLYWLKTVYKPARLPAKLPAKYYISKTRIYH